MNSPDLHSDTYNFSKPFFLIGFMGCGKSYIAKQLAATLRVPLIDLDNEIEKKERLPVSEIFTKRGEESFRKTESELLRMVDFTSPAIVACGGGTPCFMGNMDWMNAHGITIYLCPPQEIIYERLRRNKDKRPLIAEKSDIELRYFIKARIQERELFYLQAHYIIHNEHPSVDEILKKITSDE